MLLWLCCVIAVDKQTREAPSGRVPVVVRMPEDLRDALKAKAAKEERSMAQTIRYALRLYVEDGSHEF